MYSAECAGCGKEWQVPQDDRSYQCKECGGRVSVAPPAEEPLPRSSRGRAAAAFRSGADEEISEEDLQRRQDRLTISRTKQVVGVLKFVFGANAVWSLIRLLILLWLTNVATESIEEESAAENVIVGAILFVLIAFSTLILFVSVAGFLRAKFEPFIWAIILLTLTAMEFILLLFVGDPSDMFGGFVTLVVFGVITFIARKLQTALDRNPIFRERAEGKIKGKVALAARSRARRDSRRALQTFGMVAAAGLIVAGVVYFAFRPESLEDRSETFVEAWNKGSLDEVADFGYSSKKKAFLKKQLLTRGWEKKRPKLSGGRRERIDGKTFMVYKIDGEDCDVRWVRAEKTWGVAKFDMPTAEPTAPIEMTIDRFIQSWNAGAVDSLSGFMEPDRRPRLMPKLMSVLKRRGWHVEPPPFQAEYRVQERSKSSWVFLNTSEGELRTTWKVHRGLWVLTGFKFP